MSRIILIGVLGACACMPWQAWGQVAAAAKTQIAPTLIWRDGKNYSQAMRYNTPTSNWNTWTNGLRVNGQPVQKVQFNWTSNGQFKTPSSLTAYLNLYASNIFWDQVRVNYYPNATLVSQQLDPLVGYSQYPSVMKTYGGYVWSETVINNWGYLYRYWALSWGSATASSTPRGAVDDYDYVLWNISNPDVLQTPTPVGSLKLYKNSVKAGDGYQQSGHPLGIVWNVN